MTRITDFKQDLQTINEIKNGIEKKVVFLRISRISYKYRKTLLDTLELVKLLNNKQVDAYLLIVGVVYDEEVFREIQDQIEDYGRIINDNNVAIDAKKIINTADFVIGTGRSFMEAASLGKVLLSPVANLSVPVLVTQENYLEAQEGPSFL